MLLDNIYQVTMDGMNIEDAAAELERIGFVVRVEERRRPVSWTEYDGYWVNGDGNPKMLGTKLRTYAESESVKHLSVGWDRKFDARESSEWIEARLRRMAQAMGGHLAKIDSRRRLAVILT